VLNFTGSCINLPPPFPQLPGFITATTGEFGFPKETFVDVSSCQGITIVAKDFTGYKGFRLSFGTAKAPGGSFYAQGYKASIFPTVGSFGAISIPFSNFTDFWDGSTGKPIHTCAEKAEYCPDQTTLQNMKTMTIWAEGVEGNIHLEVKSVSGYGCA